MNFNQNIKTENEFESKVHLNQMIFKDLHC